MSTTTTTITIPADKPTHPNSEQAPLIAKQKHPLTWGQIIGGGIGLCVGMTSIFLISKTTVITDTLIPTKILLSMIVPINTTITGTIIGGLLNNCWSWNDKNIKEEVNNHESVTSTLPNHLVANIKSV